MNPEERAKRKRETQAHVSNQKVRENLAALAHDQWSGWLKWMFKCLEGPDREVHIARWKRQMVTPYAGLTEKEQNSDRAEADKVLAVLRASKCHHGEIVDCLECKWEREYVERGGLLL